MRLDKVKLPVLENGSTKDEWFPVADISRVAGTSWAPFCRMRVNGEWVFVGMPVAKVQEAIR